MTVAIFFMMGKRCSIQDATDENLTPGKHERLLGLTASLPILLLVLPKSEGDNTIDVGLVYRLAVAWSKFLPCDYV